MLIHFLEAGIYQINKILSPKECLVELLESLTLISRKIAMAQNFSIFHTVFDNSDVFQSASKKPRFRG